METFAGFSENQQFIPVPGVFFRELLPEIEHLGELKTILYVFWRMERLEGQVRYLRKVDFQADKTFMDGLEGTPEKALAVLDEALQMAVRRGVLLNAIVELEGGKENLYFLNSALGQAALLNLHRGEWRFTGDPHQPVEIREVAANIFRLYEENIGPLTPMLAEALREAEDSYPYEWIEEAFRIAVEKNVRNWRYVSAILNRWKEKGRHERKNRRDTEKDRRKYAGWEEENN